MISFLFLRIQRRRAPHLQRERKKHVLSIEEHSSLVQERFIHDKHLDQTDVPLTKLGAAVVEGPSDSDHVGIRLTTGQVLHWNFLVDLNNGK